MKKLYLFKALLMACLFGIFGGNLSAQEVTMDFTTNAWGLPVGSANKATASKSFTSEGYTITLAAGYYYNSDGYLMLGKKNATLTFPAFSFEVDKIVVTGNSGASSKVTQNIFVGSEAVSTATKGATGVNEYKIDPLYQAAGTIYVLTVTNANNSQITKIEVYKKASETDVQTPVITGTTPFDNSTEVTITAEDGATIHYTTDGNDPTSSSAEYSTAFTITETTTVKAIAVKGGKTSSIASKEFTKKVIYNGLSALVAQLRTDNNTSTGTAEEYLVKLTGAVVTGVDGSNVYLEEGETGLLLYKSGHGLAVGDVLSSDVTVKGFMYKGIPEITSFEGATITKGGTLPLTEVTLAQLVANPETYMSRRVKVIDATVAVATVENNTTIEQGGTSLDVYDKITEEFTLAENATVTLTGYVTLYNSSEVQLYVFDASDVIAVGGLITPDFAFSATSATANLGETFTAPTLTNTSNGTVTYSSSDEAVATIDTDGVVTIKGVAGVTTITASVAETTTYAAAEASYTLTVIDPNAKPDQYILVTSPLQLVPGDSYIIACNEEGVALATQNGTYRDKVVVTFSDDKAKITDVKEAVEVTLGGTDGSWTFSDGTGFLAAPSVKNNQLLTNETVNSYAQASITINNPNDIRIKFNTGERALILYNSANPRFSCYSANSDQTKYIQLYHKAVAGVENLYTTLTAEEEGAFYGTVYSEKAFTVPTGLEAGVITDAAANGVLTVDYRYAAGATVPAKTAVLLKGSAAEQKFVATTSDEVAPTDNLLHGADAVDADGKTFVEGSNKYYLLSFDKETGKDLGFYYGAADGAAVTYKAPYAFLAVPQAIAANLKGFRLNGEATGIESIAGTKDNANAPVFDLSGRRVQNAVKGGVYIQNGKKFIVK